MAILSTGTYSVSYRNLKRKETAVILKCIDQLPQNLAKGQYLIPTFDVNHKNFKFQIQNKSIVHLLF